MKTITMSRWKDVTPLLRSQKSVRARMLSDLA
jgi:hypothetical protein